MTAQSNIIEFRRTELHPAVGATAAAVAEVPTTIVHGAGGLDSRLRVLMVVESSGGGTGRHVLDLCTALMQRGCEVHLIYSPRRADRLFLDRLQHLPHLRHMAVPMRTVPHPADVALVWAVRRYLRRHGPFDIIHGHSSKGGAVARLAAVGTATPAIYTLHGLTTMDPDLARWKRMLYGTIELGLSLATGRIIAVSPEEHRAAVRAGLGQSRLVTVPNGVGECEVAPRAEGRRAIGIGDDHIVFGFVGRLVSQKAPHVLLEAFAATAAVEPRSRLAMVGAGPLERPMKELARMLGVQNKVLWLGERDARGVMAGFDVFTLPSRKEGLPYVALEAMAAGLPIVATNSAGVEILVENGKSGTVVERDDVEAFARAMAVLATDASLRQRFANEARQRASRFTIDAMAEQTLRTYRDLLPPAYGGKQGVN